MVASHLGPVCKFVDLSRHLDVAIVRAKPASILHCASGTSWKPLQTLPRRRSFIHPIQIRA